ncbi:RNA polymerase sigma factor [Glycocaulis sp.]|uniref:RNA polymerase sigma factor n=1 Tax=Glycocaulis sp. TaxID=1969725 RepID=UPI003D1E8D2B
MQPAYADLLAFARQRSRLIHEAEDLVQNALLAALEAGRADLDDVQIRRWLRGVIRNQARMDARSAARRKAREAGHVPPDGDDTADAQTNSPVFEWVRSLSPSLRPVAALALTGHTRAEIRSALGLSDTALRQRLRALKRAAQAGGVEMEGFAALRPDLAHGLLRRGMPAMLARRSATFGTYDPDGNLLIFRT